jgi:hypothetical protein
MALALIPAKAQWSGNVYDMEGQGWHNTWVYGNNGASEDSTQTDHAAWELFDVSSVPDDEPRFAILTLGQLKAMHHPCYDQGLMFESASPVMPYRQLAQSLPINTLFIDGADLHWSITHTDIPEGPLVYNVTVPPREWDGVTMEPDVLKQLFWVHETLFHDNHTWPPDSLDAKIPVEFNTPLGDDSLYVETQWQIIHDETDGEYGCRWAQPGEVIDFEKGIYVRLNQSSNDTNVNVDSETNTIFAASIRFKSGDVNGFNDSQTFLHEFSRALLAVYGDPSPPRPDYGPLNGEPTDWTPTTTKVYLWSKCKRILTDSGDNHAKLIEMHFPQ